MQMQSGVHAIKNSRTFCPGYFFTFLLLPNETLSSVPGQPNQPHAEEQHGRRLGYRSGSAGMLLTADRAAPVGDDEPIAVAAPRTPVSNGSAVAAKVQQAQEFFLVHVSPMIRLASPFLVLELAEVESSQGGHVHVGTGLFPLSPPTSAPERKEKRLSRVCNPQ
jgi:hypothetical protein